MLAIDIGNSLISLATWDGGRITEHIDVPTRTLETDSEVGLASFLTQIGPQSQIGIASVVPEATAQLVGLLEKLGMTSTPVILKHDDVPMQIRYDTPAELGIDRLLVSYAAHELYAKEAARAMLVVDFGTAITYNCVSETGEYLGGAITLGIGSTVRALHEFTSKLPIVEIGKPGSVLARNTPDAIRVGVLHQAMGGLDSLIGLYTTEAFNGVDPLVVVTGGHGTLLQASGATMDILDTDLLLIGIAMITERILKG